MTLARRPAALLWIAILALALTGEPAHAQAPRPGEAYQENLRVGFRVRTPDSWDATPPNEDHPEELATFWTPEDRPVYLTPQLHMRPRFSLLAFDARETGRPQGRDAALTRISRWVEDRLLYDGRWFADRIEPYELREVGGASAIHFELRPGGDGPVRIRAFACLLPLEEGLDLVLIGTGPGDDRRWPKYQRAFETLVRTFKRVPLESDTLVQPRDNSPRELRRAELMNRVRRSPGWRVVEGRTHLILTSVDDRDFIEELDQRLAAIQRYYLRDFPPALGAELRAEALRTHAPQPVSAEKEASAERARPALQSEAEIRSRLLASVVRVCRDRDEFQRYGGWTRSAGRFDPDHGELVIFDDREVRGRDHTWAALNHEAFHQYFDVVFGTSKAHAWFEEGTADFYGGFQLQGGRFRTAALAERQGIVRSLLRERRYVPLRRLARFTPIQYYGFSAYDTGPGDHYAQGWSMIYFLRHGTGREPAEWNDDWNDILHKYLAELVRTENPDWAHYVAFRGVDWEEFESAWKAYIE